MPSKIDAEKLEQAFENVTKIFPVILKEEEVGCCDFHGPNEALKKGESQWEEISKYLKSEYRVKSGEMHYMFIALRGHYNWRGWFPSITTFIYNMAMLE